MILIVLQDNPFSSFTVGVVGMMRNNDKITFGQMVMSNVLYFRIN